MVWDLIEMVVAIIFLVIVGRIVQTRIRHQSPAADIGRGDDTARLAQEVRHLKERIQVLERVITDNHSSVDLVGEIERLRDR